MDSIRAEIAPVFKKLKRLGLINQDTDIIRDYLQQLFRHTKYELQRLNNYDDNDSIEFVLCVPDAWSSKARRRMQAAMNAAAQRSGLGNSMNGIDDLFIVSETEAAAAFVLAERNNDIQVGHLLVLYKVSHDSNPETLTGKRSYHHTGRWRWNC